MKKIILRTLLWGVGVAVVLFVALVVHIYMVMGPSNVKYHQAMQLSRIDFGGATDSLLAVAEGRIRQNGAIKHSFVNKAEGIIVYGYTPGAVDPKVILASLADLPMEGRAFVVDKAAVASGCPVMDKSSFTYRLGAYIQSFF